MNYIICPYRLVSSEIWYTNPDGLAPEEVFFDVIREDFLINNQTIVFSDKHLKHVYSHIHINKPADGIALLKIANRFVEEDEQQVWCLPTAMTHVRYNDTSVQSQLVR